MDNDFLCLHLVTFEVLDDIDARRQMVGVHKPPGKVVDPLRGCIESVLADVDGFP